MHSKAHLINLDSGEELVYTLVFPNEADIQQDKISVLAPIGMAMLGYRTGDMFEWPVPDGLRRLQVNNSDRHDDTWAQRAGPPAGGQRGSAGAAR